MGNGQSKNTLKSPQTRNRYRELEKERLLAAASSIRLESRYRALLAARAHRQSGMRARLHDARRMAREMKRAHHAVDEEHFDLTQELLRVREEARVLWLQDSDPHAKHVYKTFLAVLDSSRDLKQTHGRPQAELQAILQGFRHLDTFTDYQLEKARDELRRSYAESCREMQQLMRRVRDERLGAADHALPIAELYTPLLKQRINVVALDERLKQENESRSVLLKALRVTLDSLEKDDDAQEQQQAHLDENDKM